MDLSGDRLGIAIIGCGYWGANYVRIFDELPDSYVVAVCDQRPERLRDIGRRFPRVALLTGIEDTLRRDDVGAVVVCTPATTHYSVTRCALEAGKHVLVEKPMTTALTEADDLITLASSRSLTLLVGHTFLYNSAIRKVKDYIAQDKLGGLYYLYACRTNLGPIRRDVNALWDLAPHDVAIFNYLLDSTPTWVSAVGAKVLRNCREDVGFISLGYPENIVGHIHVSWADPNKVREVVVVGSDKRIVFNDLNSLEQVRVFEKGVIPVPVEVSSYGDYQLLLRDGDIVSPRIEASEPLKNQCAHFVECVLRGQAPFTDGWSGRAVVEVLVAIDRSIARNGAPVELAKENLYDHLPNYAASTVY
jgi:predicted dehydrogenase